jgi:hypothetical protein
MKNYCVSDIVLFLEKKLNILISYLIFECYLRAPFGTLHSSHKYQTSRKISGASDATAQCKINIFLVLIML